MRQTSSWGWACYGGRGGWFWVEKRAMREGGKGKAMALLGTIA